MTRINRRLFLGSCLAAGQVALLERFGLSSRASALDPSNGPSKMLTIFVNGGLHYEHLFTPFRPAKIGTFFEGAEQYPRYRPEWVENWDGSGDADADGAVKRLRGPVWWDWRDPSRNRINSSERHPEGRHFDPKGYAWAAPEHRLYEDAVVIHGIDQQTAAHQSGIVASTCGMAGANYAAPAIQAVVANAFASYFPDRVIPSVVIGRLAAPAVGLPASAGPQSVEALSDMAWTLSDRPDSWEGLRSRRPVTDPGFAEDAPQPADLTHIDSFTLESIRRLRGESSRGMDARLEQLYQSYRGHSKALANDIVGVMESTPGFEYLPANHPSWMPGEALLGWRIGYADAVSGGQPWRSDFDLALRFLKTNLSSSVAVRMMGHGQYNFDTHYSNPYRLHSENLHGIWESIGQVLVEMKNTPSPDRADKTLLDDTLVYIYSDFGRTFIGSDHNPMTSAILVGGEIQGNRMYGGFEDSVLGMPVLIREEDGREVMRPPKSQDTIATALSALGLHMGEDFFLPGGYGEVVGVRREG
jgi:hypothetical protein